MTTPDIRPNTPAALLRQLEQRGLADGWALEVKFHPTRKFRFDLAHVGHRLAVEVDGGIWRGGRHSGGAGQEKDMEKASEAAILGYRIVRVTPRQVASGAALALVERALGAQGEEQAA